MRAWFVVVAIVAFAVSPAGAAEVAADSSVEAVTVFISGAEVTRRARLSLEQGAHTLVFDDLPADAVPASIRVSGNATAKLDIGSVDTRRRFVPRADQALLQQRRKDFEDQIEKLRDERGLLQGQQDAANTQKRLLGNLADLPGRREDQKGPLEPLPPTDWNQILSVIASGTMTAQRAALDAEVKMREVDRQIAELEKQLSILAPAKTEQTEVKVFVAAEGPLEAELTLRYQVANASWKPQYEARLSTGSKTEKARLDLARRAAIRQRSGESWENVALKLSTTRPTSSAAAPQLHTITVDFEPEPKPQPKPMSPPPSDAARSAAPRGGALRAMKGLVSKDDSVATQAMAEAEVTSATAVALPFQVTFDVPGRVTIPSTGEVKAVKLGGETTEPVLTVRTVPKVDTTAYLYAKFALPKGSPVLPGNVSLFRDGTFVGVGKLPLLSSGEDHELGFGADDQVRVRHSIVEETRGETGLISSARTDSRHYRVSIKNRHQRAIELVVIDQVPVPENQDIKVEYTGSTNPTEGNVDGERGVLSFESKLEPEEERVIDFGYRVTWPGKRPIMYSR